MLKNISKLEKTLYILAYLVLIFIYIFFKSGTFEFLGSVFLLSGVILNTKGIRFWFLFSGIGVLIYSYVAFKNRLYSEVIINILYMTPVQIWGYIKWKKDNENNLNLQVKSLEKKHIIFIILFVISLTSIYGYFLLEINNTLPFLSAFATACSVLGATFAAKKIKQQFVFWILNNIALVIIWFYTLNGTTVQLPILIINIIFILININGLRFWDKMYKQQNI